MTRPEPRQWTSGDAYEQYVGRWSSGIASRFLAWLDVAPGRSWVDVGCGTGVLTRSILQACGPSRTCGVDRSVAYAHSARTKIDQPSTNFVVADAQFLPLKSGAFEIAVSGLVLNFVPDPKRMVSEMTRVVVPDGMVALYVWDYAGQMQMMRHFWDAAARLDPSAADLDEGARFSVCHPERLNELFVHEGLREVAVRPVDTPTVFRDFDDYWNPFLGGQGPAASYLMSLSEEKRAALQEELRSRLPVAQDGSIHLVARAWAVKATRP